MKDIKVCFSHNTDDWRTPSNIYDYFVNKRGYIDTFPFQSSYNEFENDYFYEKLFINPPFSKLSKVSSWIKRQVIQNKCLCALLIPSRTDTIYFHELLKLHPSIYFIKGRLHYNDSVKPAPFPSIILIFQPIFDLKSRWFVFDK